MQKWVQKNRPKKCHFWRKMSKKHVFFCIKFRRCTGQNAKKTPLFFGKNTKKHDFLKSAYRRALHGFWPKLVIFDQKMSRFLNTIFQIAPRFGRILVEKKCHFFVKTETAKNRFLIKETCGGKPGFSGFWKKVVHFLITFWPILVQKPWRALLKRVLAKRVFFDHHLTTFGHFWGTPYRTVFHVFWKFWIKNWTKLDSKKNHPFLAKNRPFLAVFGPFLRSFFAHFCCICIFRYTSGHLFGQSKKVPF